MKKTITSLLLMLLVVVSAWGQTSGSCGADATWELNGTTLMITGSGAMWNYEYSGSNIAPWNGSKGTITAIVMSDDITAIGDNAFNGCANITSFAFPSKLTTIGACAFEDCRVLKSVDFSGCSDCFSSFSS